MILTGGAIRKAIDDEDIIFSPFSEKMLNPNSINYRLGEELFEVVETARLVEQRHRELRPNNGRILLKKGNLYLGHTLEIIGSKKYVASLIGRSSIGRLGLFVQVSANLGHVGAIHRWTLELVPSVSIYVYPGQVIGQVSFWECFGEQSVYSGWFGRHDRPMPSKYYDPIFANSGTPK